MGDGGGGVKTSLGDSNVESSLRSSVLFKQTELFTGMATEDLSSFLLQGALPCVKPLCVRTTPPHPAPTIHTTEVFVSLEAFIIYWYPVLRWEQNALLSCGGGFLFLPT